MIAEIFAIMAASTPWAFPAFHIDMRQKREQTRDFPGKRILNVLLRTAHLVGVVLFGAALLAGQSTLNGAWILMGSGVLMFAIDTWAKPRHLLELSGAGILLKLALIGLSILQPAWALALFWAVVVLSTLLSHAPGWLRHRRVIPGATTQSPN